MKYISILVCLILVCGCMTPVRNQNETPATAIPPTVAAAITTAEPTPDLTFATSRPLKYHTYAEETPTKVPTTSVTTMPKTVVTNCKGTAIWEKEYQDIVGKWILRDGPYPCSAFFEAGGSGTITCGIFPVIETRNVVWSGNNGVYTAIVMPDTKTSVSIKDGIMTADILPSGSYMVRL